MKTLVVTFATVGFLASSALMTQAVAQGAIYSPDEQAKIDSVNKAAKTTTPVPLVATENKETAVACTKCFTCGGDWPIFEGSQFTGTGQVSERGGNCSGVVGSETHNTIPFLCCR